MIIFLPKFMITRIIIVNVHNLTILFSMFIIKIKIWFYVQIMM
nr:MAG TPA: hypothetical protein [Caudoviricetes sp.]